MATDTSLFGSCLVAAALTPSVEVKSNEDILRKTWSLYRDALQSVKGYDFHADRDRPIPDDHESQPVRFGSSEDS